MAFKSLSFLRRKSEPAIESSVPTNAAGSQEEWDKFFDETLNDSKKVSSRVERSTVVPREPFAWRNAIAIGLITTSTAAIGAVVFVNAPRGEIQHRQSVVDAHPARPIRRELPSKRTEVPKPDPKPIHVRSYVKKDGTVVDSHERGAARSKTKTNK